MLRFHDFLFTNFQSWKVFLSYQNERDIFSVCTWCPIGTSQPLGAPDNHKSFSFLPSFAIVFLPRNVHLMVGFIILVAFAETYTKGEVEKKNGSFEGCCMESRRRIPHMSHRASHRFENVQNIKYIRIPTFTRAPVKRTKTFCKWGWQPMQLTVLQTIIVG